MGSGGRTEADRQRAVVPVYERWVRGAPQGCSLTSTGLVVTEACRKGQVGALGKYATILASLAF